MKRVLLLTASYGSGHNAAARCLAQAFERDGCAVTVVDHFRELVSPLFERASRALYHAILRRGIPGQRIVVTGMPVRAEFAEPADPTAVRAALGLGDRAPVVLAMAGSRGSFGRLPDVARALDALERPLQGLLVAGHDA